MNITREMVLAVADWWEKQDGGDTNQPEADRLRSAAMWADPAALRLSANDAHDDVLRAMQQEGRELVAQRKAMGLPVKELNPFYTPPDLVQRVAALEETVRNLTGDGR